MNTFARLHNTAARTLERVLPDDALALAARIGIGAIFWLSGRTKVDGTLRVTEGAIALFRDEFKLPLIAPELAAHLAAYAEHVLPLLLLVSTMFTPLPAASFCHAFSELYPVPPSKESLPIGPS